MKRLYLLRHAKAVSSANEGDKARELAPRGIEDSLALGDVMRKKNYKPDFVLCSPSARTQQTWTQISKSLDDVPTEMPEALYHANAGDYMAHIQDTPDQYNAVLLVGHNPSLHELAARLSSEDSSQSPLGRLIQSFKPCAFAVYDCPVEHWANLNLGDNILTDFMEPIDFNAPATPARWT